MRVRRAVVVVSATLALLAACASASPRAVAPSDPTPEAGTGAVAAVPDAAACTMTRAFTGACQACVAARCCQPPVAFSTALATAVGCPLGCRKTAPMAGANAAAVLATCTERCSELFPDPTGEATRLAGCLGSACTAECLPSP